MKNRVILLSVLLGLSLAGTPASAGETPAGERMVGAVTITNSGSTNMRGYSIEVAPGGTASFRSGDEARSGMLPPAIARKLFSDLQGAGALDALAAGACAKSASFGTVTTVTYDGKTSPDLSCGGDDKTALLYADVQAVQQALDIKPPPRHPLANPVPVP